VDANFPVIAENRQKVNGKRNTPPNIFDNIIKPFHRIMKSGNNFGKYERSFLFKYFHNNNNIHYGNDKSFVKSSGIAPVISKERNTKREEHIYTFKKYKYVRALLGVTEKIEYIHELDKNEEPTKDSKGKVIKDVVTIKSTCDVDRYASPVRYRVIGKSVYIFSVPIPDRLFGAVFNFSSPCKSGDIAVPNKSDFDINVFLSAFVKHINMDSKARAAAHFETEKFVEVK
jgi:hypothetical protein